MPTDQRGEPPHRVVLCATDCVRGGLPRVASALLSLIKWLIWVRKIWSALRFDIPSPRLSLLFIRLSIKPRRGRSNSGENLEFSKGEQRITTRVRDYFLPMPWLPSRVLSPIWKQIPDSRLLETEFPEITPSRRENKYSLGNMRQRAVLLIAKHVWIFAVREFL